MSRLEGKVALITGAAMGLGKDMATLFAKEGARLGLLDLNKDALTDTAGEIKGLGSEVSMGVGNVMDIKDVEAWVNSAIAQFDHIDILVNNAGIYKADTIPGSDKTYDATEEAWNMTMDVNLKGAWYCCKTTIPYMLRRQKGKIINIASVNGLVGTVQSLPYICAKHGMIGLTRALAADLAAKGINVNAICPAEVDTPLNRSIRDEYGPWEVIEQGWLAKSLIPPPIPMDSVSKLALFLASSDSDYLFGRSIHLGAWAALVP